MAEFDFGISAKLEHMFQGPSDLADHLLTYLEALSNVDPLLTDWYRPGKSRRDALVHPLLLKGRRTKDAVELLTSRCKPDAHDFVVSCWNGLDMGDERSVGLTAELPSHPTFMGSNLSLSYSLSGHATATPLPLVQGITRIAVCHWPVEWARAYSYRTHERVAENWDDTTAGWITYLAGDVDLRVPPGVQVFRKFADRGTLFVVSEENPTPDDAVSIGRLRELTHLFWDSSLLPRRPELPKVEGIG